MRTVGINLKILKTIVLYFAKLFQKLLCWDIVVFIGLPTKIVCIILLSIKHSAGCPFKVDSNCLAEGGGEGRGGRAKWLHYVPPINSPLVGQNKWENLKSIFSFGRVEGQDNRICLRCCPHNVKNNLNLNSFKTEGVSTWRKCLQSNFFS